MLSPGNVQEDDVVTNKGYCYCYIIFNNQLIFKKKKTCSHQIQYCSGYGYVHCNYNRGTMYIPSGPREMKITQLTYMNNEEKELPAVRNVCTSKSLTKVNMVYKHMNTPSCLKWKHKKRTHSSLLPAIIGPQNSVDMLKANKVHALTRSMF